MGSIVPIPTPRWRNFLAFQYQPLAFMERVVPMGDLISLRSGVVQPSYVVGAPEVVQDILVTYDRHFQKGRSSDILRRTIGEGLLTTEGAVHEAQRKMMLSLFYKEQLHAYAEAIVDETDRLIHRMKEQRVWSMHEQMMGVTLSIICRTLFATDVQEMRPVLSRAVDDAIIATAKTLYAPLPLPFSFPTPRHMVHRRANRTLRTFVNGILQEAKQDRARYAHTLLNLLLSTTDASGQPLSDEHLCDQMMTMVIAGHETTANLLSWTWFLLAKHPDVQEQFHQEIDQVTAENAFALYRKLPYTLRIVQEVLRLYPPAWMIVREVREPVSLLEESFGPRSAFLICPYAFHRQERWFPQAHAFVPDRFLEGKATWPKFAYFPFGGGSRSCIGSQFALLEAVLILRTLGRMVQFERTTSKPIRADPLVSLRIAGTLEMTAHVRRRSYV